MQPRILAFSGVACAAVVVLDQLSKAWVRDAIPPGALVQVLGRLHLTHVANTGLVFGIGQGNVLLPALASILILILIPVVIWRAHHEHGYTLSALEAACVALIAGGAIGNLIDRLTIQHVTDFLLVRLFGDTFWPAFNVADMAIVCGTFLLIFSVIHRDLRHGAQPTGTA
ncbi:MAG: signal peptidase II [Chloroflexota bacterium]